jgi:hypothetical protein
VFVIKCNIFNMQDSFILLSNTRARGPQVAQASFSVIDELAFRCTVCQIGVSLIKWQLVASFCYRPRSIYRFMTATAENQVSQKDVVTK